jgi:uncharacterized membrane protein YjjP (DUF1212 family)
MSGPNDPRANGHDSELAGVLGDVAAGLHGVSVPTDVVEEEIQAIAKGQGVPLESLILESRMELQVGKGRDSEQVLRSIESDPGWNLRRLSDLQGVVSKLRGRGAATTADLAGARREIAEIVSRPVAFSPLAVTLAYGVYGAAVPARVGGGWLEVVAGIAVGLAAGAVHFGSTRSRQLDLLQSFTGALLGTLVAFLLRLVLPPFDQARAVFGGISLLVPAMVLTIGTREIVHEALESGVFRLTYGLLRFVMLGFGAAVAIALYGLFASPPPTAEPEGLHKLIQLGLVALGGLALTVCLQGRWRDAPWMVVGAVVAFGSHEATKLIFPPNGSAFFATFLLTAVAVVQYRLGGRIPAVLIIPGFLQVAPGFLGTESVLALLRPGVHHRTDNTFFDVMLLALQLVTGMLVAELVFGWRGPRPAHSRPKPGLPEKTA